MNPLLVSAKYLNDRLNETNIKIIDVSMDKVAIKNPIIYSNAMAIPNSHQIKIEQDWCDTNSSLPNAFPSLEQIQHSLAQIGATHHSQIILYDNQGVYSSPRAWWILTYYGFTNVSILDGGLPGWREQLYPVVKSYLPKQAINSFNTQKNNKETPENNQDSINRPLTWKNIHKEDILMNLSNLSSSHSTTAPFVMIDARSAERFSGSEPDPKGGRTGHIPNSLNLPFPMVLNGYYYKESNDLKEIFQRLLSNSLHNSVNKPPIIFTCGSGITACIILCAALIAGFNDVSLYDASWSEWGQDFSLPIEKTQNCS